MNIAIHRGANQIGGCITEISTDGAKILIDLGSNLPGSKAKELDAEDVAAITQGVDAIFYTHYHGDHIGLFSLVPHDTPQYIGAGARDVMLCKFEALSKHMDYSEEIEAIRRMKTYATQKPISIKDRIKVTPYFVSHSAFDAYMFLIETEGKKILHTGDFRKHGYLGKGLFPMLKSFVGQVDVLITEGTMLCRVNEVVKHENSIKYDCIKLLRKSKPRFVFALCSSTDIDRLASFSLACKETDTVFLCDNYQKRVLDIFAKYAGRKSEIYRFDNVRILRICEFNTLLKRKGFLMPVRLSHEALIQKMLYYFPEAELIYSLWPGYYKGTNEQQIPEAVNIKKLFSDNKFHYLHTSGHADIETLQEVCRIVDPRLAVVPIHKDASSSFQSLEISKEYNIIESSTCIDNVSIHLV